MFFKQQPTLKNKVFGFVITLGFLTLPSYGMEEIGKDYVWKKPGIPHSGWTHIKVEDRDIASFQCQMCDKEEIRYVHTVFHPDAGELEVGCVCAENMTGDLTLPKQREKEEKNKTQRLKRQQDNLPKWQESWLDMGQWTVNEKENVFRKLGKDYFTIFKNKNPRTPNDLYKFVYQNKFSPQGFPSPEAAIEASFDIFKNFKSKGRSKK